jgi:hypothetical protein
MLEELATVAVIRYHSALAEGMTEHEAFTEILQSVLRAYAERVGS